MWLKKLNPAVSKYWLIALSGFMWSTVGIMLCHLAYTWLWSVNRGLGLPLGFVGIASALAVHGFGFSKIALKNIYRLCRLPDKCCIFAFQAWKSYLIIIFMIALGMLLRGSSIPRHFLAVVYFAIGGALFVSSIHFYRCIWRVKILKQPCWPHNDNKR
jgi:hypothetical protein